MQQCEFCRDYGFGCSLFDTQKSPFCQFKIESLNVRDAILLGSLEEFDYPL